MERLKFLQIVLIIIIIFQCFGFKESYSGELSSDELYNLYQNGLDYYLDKDYKKALEIFKQVLEIDPNYGVALFQMGQTYHDMGEHEMALKLLLKAEEIDVRTGEITIWMTKSTLAKVYYYLGRYGEAINKAIESKNILLNLMRTNEKYKKRQHRYQKRIHKLDTLIKDSKTKQRQ